MTIACSVLKKCVAATRYKRSNPLNRMIEKVSSSESIGVGLSDGWFVVNWEIEAISSDMFARTRRVACVVW